MTHNYKRHGTTTLFDALDALQGRVLGQCMARHRHREFTRSTRSTERPRPGGSCTRSSTAIRRTGIPSCGPGSNGSEVPLHPDLGLLAQCRRRLLRQAVPAAAQLGVFKGIVDPQAAINRYQR